MARLNTGTRIYGTANVDSVLTVGQVTPNNANVGLANTGSLQVLGAAYISGNTTIGGQSTTEQIYIQGNSNLLRFSQNFENIAWGKVTSDVRFGPSANTFAPDGTNTASQLINNTGGLDSGYAGQDVTTLNRNTPYTFSVFLKQGNAPFGQVNLYAANGGLNDALANVNFNTGTVTASGTNLINSTFVNVGGGWYRVSITLNTLNQQKFINRVYTSGFSGLSGQFSYFWGAQLEPGITPSAYANTSSGNIVKANNNLFVMGNTFVLGGNTSTSNTTGSLIVHGGLGVSGNVNVSNTINILSLGTENKPLTIQGGQSGLIGARIGAAEALDFYTSGFPYFFATGGARTITQFAIEHKASAVNYLSVAGNTTGGGVVISGQGSDTNIGININPKGAGSANVTSTANSTSNTSGALVVTGGMGITGNLFMSAANNYSLTTTLQDSYRLGWSDNYFTRSPVYTGLYFTGNFLAIRTGPFYIEGTSSFIARGVITNDSGNNTVIFNGVAPVRLQNTAASTSNTTGALIVGGGIGVTGNVVSNSYITSTDTSNYLVRIDGFTGSGPKIEFGSPAAPNSFMAIGAYNGLNNFETGSRNFRLGSTTVPNIMQANAATGQITFANNVIISGNLTVVGNVSSENVQSLSVADPLIKLGIGNYTSDLRDIGFAAHYNDGTNAHTGLIRDAGTKEYYLFQGYTPELDSNNNVIITDASFRTANLNANFVRANLVANNIIVRGAITDDEGNGVVIFGTSSPVLIQNITTSTSNTTGALVVNGGLGVSGNVYVSGIFVGGQNNTANGQFAFIGGGGGPNVGEGNAAAGANSAIVGGQGNLIQSTGLRGFIGGGLGNRIGGSSPSNAVIVGGSFNGLSAQHGFLGGGFANALTNDFAVLNGGYNNGSTGAYGVVGGGIFNTTPGSYSVVSGGYGNQAGNDYAGIVTGRHNTANGNFSFVGGGGGTSVADGNYAAGANSAIVGGATNSIVSGANYSFIGGGEKHRIESSAGYSTIVGGSNHSSQNIYNFIGGGTSNFAYSQYGVVCGGFNNGAQFLGSVGGGQYNSAAGSYSVVAGGFQNLSNGYASAIPGGAQGTTRNIAYAQAFGQGSWGKQGAAQLGTYALVTITSSSAANTMTSDGNWPETIGNQVALPANSAYIFSGSVVGTEIEGADTAMWTFQGGIKRGVAAGSTALVGTPIINLIAQDGGASSWSVAITANTTLGSLQVSVVGDPSATVRWVSRVDTTEVTF
jgi:hypothetical protein